ncbi:hypothetical protein O0I10_004282 [Lichtheimia ornata]|uniref:Heterokaryon incompatibility domain-containing protein n=1 Tax=Lichtheimia ornata TaxID=688661 RepID=A0AAD7V624_9FUNG|nr:uncharacterized protein O0I10_004282 [Lichtheimia ornata]KAJ8660054.1 hypothetical protein O0I10_004282 [Lichtheimia ornata]
MTVTISSKYLASRKAVLQKEWTLDDIFTHPDFRLLYVPSTNEQGGMTIITPSKHRSSYLHGREFYALSHLWGTEPNKHMWDVSDLISDEEGTLVEPIPMRPEKRKTLLSLLQSNPGYWWIDVLCCRSDTPPVIMSGVYGCCKRCYAMIDCSTSAIWYLSVKWDPNYLVQLFHPTGNYVGPMEKKEYLKKLFQYVYDVYDSRWFTRVWTLQEATLPSCVILLSETCDAYTERKTIKLRSLLNRYGDVGKHAECRTK